MDEIVRQALAKWPNVPHCYGWLALDARGNWRMRDARAQALQLPGDKIVHGALLGFIVRNYGRDERGCWYFQNGPQRVYVTLEATPHIVRTDPAQGLLLHTGSALDAPDAAFLCDGGALLLCQGDIVAQLDDRDMAGALATLEIGGQAAGDDDLLAWLDGADNGLTLRLGGRCLTLQHLAHASLAIRFDFVQTPEPA